MNIATIHAEKQEVVLRHYGIGQIFLTHGPQVAAYAATLVYSAVYQAISLNQNQTQDFVYFVESCLKDYGIESVVPYEGHCYCDGMFCGNCQDYDNRLNYLTNLCMDIAVGMCINDRGMFISGHPGLKYVEILDNDHVVFGAKYV